MHFFKFVILIWKASRGSFPRAGIDLGGVTYLFRIPQKECRWRFWNLKGETSLTFKEICKNEEINAYLKKGDENLGQLGYTDHSQAHCVQVARQAGKILERFGYSDHEIELVKIAGYMHDIGNAINRTHHAEYGALLANSLLKEMDMPLDDRITIMSAIGNHDESTGGPEDVISAALIIADKTDVRRSRVREKERAAFDIHDRVNYAVTESKLKIEKDRSVIALNLQVDEKICSMYDYFEIFLGRMMLCRKSAEILGTTFKLTVNGRKVL